MRTGRFYQWVSHHADGDGHFAELIEQIRSDGDFPKWVASRDSAREYLESRSAAQSSLAALDLAWDEFEKTDWGI